MNNLQISTFFPPQVHILMSLFTARCLHKVSTPLFILLFIILKPQITVDVIRLLHLSPIMSKRNSSTFMLFKTPYELHILLSFTESDTFAAFMSSRRTGLRCHIYIDPPFCLIYLFNDVELSDDREGKYSHC